MQRSQTVLLVAVIALVPGAMMATSAHAGVEALNAAGEATTATFSGGSEKEIRLSFLEISSELECTKSKSEGTLETGGKLGAFHIALERCTLLKFNCESLGDPAGTILLLGTIHLAADHSLTHGLMLLLFEHSHFLCEVAGISNLFLGLGEYLCEVTPINVLSSALTITCNRGAEPGDPAVTEYTTDKGEAGTLTNPLKASKSDTSESMSALQGQAVITVTPMAKLDV